MIPLIPALVLAFFSFICSAFVIFRIVVPILPPHPLSRRVAPSEFGLPNFRSLSSADKSHLWLASLDLLALVVFVWQAISEYSGGPTGYSNAQDPLASARLWFTLTVRQTCLLVIAAITLLHVRLGRSVTFGTKHWMIWGLTLVFVVTSTVLAGVLSAANMTFLFVGLLSYSTFMAVCSSVAFGCLISTLLNIKRNLTTLNEEEHDTWPPPKEAEEQPRPSFTTDEIDAIRDGASWITSNASSRRDSISQWSFTTHHTTVPSHHVHGRPQNGGHPSVPGKSSFWFSPMSQEHIPPVPPLPSPYGPISPTAASLAEADPFGRTPTPQLMPQHPRQRFGSQTSWLTSSAGSHANISAWSFPATHHEGSIHNASSPNLNTQLLPSTAVSRPSTPAMAEAKVLGGYGYIPKDSEAGLTALAAAPGTSLDITTYRAIGWFIIIWLPLGLSYPYFISLSQDNTVTTLISVLLALSVTLSSPLLALNILCGSLLPIPDGLFDVHGDLPSNLTRGPSPTNTEATLKWSHEYKRSTSASVTVIEGRRSGDVWISKGDAVNGRSKVSRAMSMMSPMPKLSVLPTQEMDDGELTPPLPIQIDDTPSRLSYHNRSHSESSAQFGRIRKESQASSRASGADDSLAFASRIMIAQRHYSALAQTVHVPASPEKRASADERVLDEMASQGFSNSIKRTSAMSAGQHLRTRSVSSISGPKTPTTGESFSVTPPPAFPLPPTPPNVRAARLAKQHKRSFSSGSASGYTFGAVDDMNEIDALTAGVLPLLVPGLKVGQGMRIKDSPPATWSRRGRADARSQRSHSRSRSRSAVGKVDGKTARLLKALDEFGEEFSSPEVHSTPARTRAKAMEQRKRKTSAHRRNHMSLPSLGLGKDGVHSFTNWANDVGRALENKIGQYTAVPSSVEISQRRNTVFGGETSSGVRLEAASAAGPTPSVSKLGRAMSTRTLGLRAEVPHGVDTARSSIVSAHREVVPPSAASTVTLFDFEASGPQAESTPHNNTHKRTSEQVDDVPPLPTANQIGARTSRRSSIVYIKSDENAIVTPPNHVNTVTQPTSSTSSSLAQWSSRAIRPLIPKSSKLLRKSSKVESSSAVQAAAKPESPRTGLRPLSLLQDRNPNSDFNSNGAGPVVETVAKGSTRPLLLGKKQKSRGGAERPPKAGDENVNPDAAPRAKKHNLKPLNLARSETSKMRAILRAKEELPNVVIRPPSTIEHQVYGY